MTRVLRSNLIYSTKQPFTYTVLPTCGALVPISTRCYLSRNRPFTLSNRHAKSLHEEHPGKMEEVVGETVTFQGTQYTAVREGLASILTPYRDPSGAQTTHTTSRNNNNNTGVQEVFYNKIQQFNRDLTILAILIHGEGALVVKTAKVNKRPSSSKKQWERKKGKRDFGQSNGVHSRKQEAQEDHADDDAESDSSPVIKIDGPTRKRKYDEIFEAEDGDGTASKKTRTEGEPQREDGARAESAQIPDMVPPAKGRKPRYSILDALSATGLRALRYAKEIPFVTRIVANDLLPEAVKAIEMNVEFNGLENTVTPNQDDARAFLYSKIGNEMPRPHSDSYVHRFDVIDLDPYGTAAPFFDAAVQALQDGGLLCVTCTDAGVFASNGYPEKAYALYAGTTMKGVQSHEAGLRLILHAVALSAAKYGIAIEPLLSLSIDFYARLFIRIHKRQQDVKFLSGTSMVAYNCDSGCGAWTVQKVGRNIPKENKKKEVVFHYSYAQGPSATPNCEHCGFKTHLAGPMWSGPLHNPYFIQAILAKLPTLDRTTYGTITRIEGMLKTAIEEIVPAGLDIKPTNGVTSGDSGPSITSPVIPRMPPETDDPMPFFFIPTFLAKVLHCTTPSEALLRSAFISLGYVVTRSHCKPGSFKTNAPWPVIWEILREWVRKEAPVRAGALKDGTAGYEIMKKARGTDAAKVQMFTDELSRRLARVANSDDLKLEMEAGMFRLRELEALVDNIDGNVDGSTKQILGSDPRKLKIIFDEKLGKEKKEKLVRYQINMPHWGPMNRATGRSD